MIAALPVCCVVALIAPVTPVAGAPGSTGSSIHAKIDKLIAAADSEYAKKAAPIASDAEFLRRVMLDLTGRIPTAEATRAFLADRSPKKRERLIDQLLASQEYARRMQEYFDVLLMDRRRENRVSTAEWQEYLRKSFADNKPYNVLIREILSADGVDPKTRATAKFFLERDLDPTTVTRDISRLFLGRNLQCAQCHDHPLIDDYKQAHFYGIQAFFNRAYLYPSAKEKTAIIAEKADGEVNFTSVFDVKKTMNTTAPRVLDRKPIADPMLSKGKEYKVAPAKDVRPIPAYSRFSQLANALTATDNTAFPRTAANRLWAMMLGRGLVHPLDLDHSDNPPSHPELMDLLAEQFAAHNSDVKWLLREIALSDTYQRSSEPTDPNADLPEDGYYVGILKPLTPEQLAYSVMQATGFTDSVRLGFGKKTPTEAELHAKLVPNAAPFLGMFGSRPGEPEDGFVSTLDQTLFFKHGAHIQGLISPRVGSTVERAAALTDPKLAADELYLSVFTRMPTDEERRDIADTLAASKDRKADIAAIVWAMIASAEFRFNH